uniref:Syntaxin-binding protein 5-like n=1 Tax=Electrophorus electricus TaxID=8005 RepID=A0AAY5EXD3_ELEEL
MKKFNIRKVFDGLTAVSSSSSSASPQPSNRENDIIQETLQSEHFQLCKTVRHGFPYQPSAMAFDPVQKILVIGTQSGALRLFGRAGLECYCQHEGNSAVIQLQFLINEGALVSALSDDSIHLWNLRQKIPAILHSLKFNRERITFCHLPFQSKWLYIGTERGNIHIVNVESFTLSGYVIMWNKAIELSSKNHPGPVVHISDNPMDEGKLLIGFECGIVVLWDLRSKKADYRYSYDEAIHSVAWHHEGKQFVCSHSDGTLTTWNVRSPAKPAQIITPHGKQPRDGRKPDPCKPILKVEYKTAKAGEPFMVLSGGLSYDTVGRRACLTVMHGKSTAVLEMDYPIVDFLTLCETPYPNDYQEPYAVVVLLEKDLVVVDLAQTGYPSFENPYPLSIHESPVTCCEYFADCPAELIPALYSVGSRQKRQGYSKKEWPISGGNWGQGAQSYPEIIITGHADGSVKFWDASALMLQVLYKLKTAKVFEKVTAKEEKPSPDVVDEDPFAIHSLSWCPESRVLCLAAVSAHVIVYRFSKHEVTTETVQLLEVRMQCELNDVDSLEGGGEQASAVSTPGASSSPQGSTPQPHPSSSSTSSSEGLRDNVPCLKYDQPALPFAQAVGIWFQYQEMERCVCLCAVTLVVWLQWQCPGCLVVLFVVFGFGCVLQGQEQSTQTVPRLPGGTGHPAAVGLCDGNDGGATSEDRCNIFVLKPLLSLSLSSFCPLWAPALADARDGSFIHSRSSSMGSIDREAREVISSLHFFETLSRKNELVPVPSLWLGTSLGTVLAISLLVPSASELRLQQAVAVSFCGSVVRLKGGILRMAVMDSTGSLVPPACESWYDPNAPEEERERTRSRRPTSPSSSQENQDCQYAVVCSEKQAKVVALPSQNCIYDHNITETSFVLRADVVIMSAGICVACFCANGHIMTLSLPSLRPLLDVNYLPLTDMRIARTFCFSNLGQALYLTSPMEIQRLTYSQETCDNLQEMLGELFTPVETPEAPNRGFFKGLFGGGAQSLDREDLFGELAAGRASRSLAQHIPGPGSMEGMKGAASGVVGELARARIALDERGQKLGELEERTAAMMASADAFSRHAHDVSSPAGRALAIRGS